MLKEISEKVKHIGRTCFYNDTIWCGLSGSGIEFSFTGKNAELVFKGDNTANIPCNDTNYARVAVYVDGVKLVDTQMDCAEKKFTVASSDTVKTLVIRVIKLSEAAMSNFGISDIITDGVIAPTEDKKLKVEIIGDSITCGYGVDDEDKMHHFSTATEDVTKAYSFKTMKALDADYSFVSYSGYGIISGYTGDGVINAFETLPKHYKKFAFSYGKLDNSVEPVSIEWDFKRFMPDLIIVNLGTNDDSYCLDDAERQNVFRKEYKNFITEVHNINPDAKLLCVLGIMGRRLCPVVEAAVEDFKKESGFKAISTMRFEEQLEEDGRAADWHPTAVTHDKASAVLIDEIKRIMK